MTRDEIIAWVIANDEGGLVTLAGDPGGTTNRGISQRLLDKLRESDPTLPASVADLTDAQTHDIYVIVFWNPISGDELPPGLALMAMDMAVNEGPGTAAMCLQRAVGANPDGLIGPTTQRMIAAANPKSLAAEFCARRAVEYAKLYAAEGQFELGWMRRLVRVYTVAVS